jgi:DNA-binding transcriptional LysR family regulator
MILSFTFNEYLTRIKQLEEELGAPLFYREGKILKLTPSGEIFLNYVVALMP